MANKGGSVSTKIDFPNFLKVVMGIIALWILYYNVRGIVLLGTVQHLKYIARHPLESYEKKMQERVGPIFYDYVQFIKYNTPEDAAILLPPYPALPWPQTSNDAYMRYFLYPRTLINGKQFEPGLDINKEGIDYILIAWGEGPNESSDLTHGWPKFDVPAARILYLKGEPAKSRNDYYLYKDHVSTGSWGLIEVRK